MKKSTMMLLAICMILVGCQPTPNQQIVVQKNTDRMIEAATDQKNDLPSDANSLRTISSIPDTYRTKLDGADGNLVIDIDAPVIIPACGTLPVVRVEAANFEQGFISSFVETIFQGKVIFYPPKEYTKSRIQKIILDAQSDLARDDIAPETRADLEARILQWQSKLPDAPDDAAPAYATPNLQDGALNITSLPNGEGKQLLVQNDADESALVQQEVVQQESGIAYDVYTRRSMLLFTRDEAVSAELPLIERGASLVADVTDAAIAGGTVERNKLSISPTDAKLVAERFLGEAGIDDMVVHEIWLISNYLPKDILELMVSRGSLANVNEYYNQTAEKQVYEVHCSRVIQNVAVASDTFFNSRSSMNDDFFSKEWFYEELHIYVDEQGVAMFRWSAPLLIFDVVTDNAAIQPFPAITEIFEKMMMVKHEPQYKGTEAGASTFTVKKVVLSLQRISEQNSVSTGLLIPVWNFYGNQTSYHVDGSKVTNDAYGIVPLMTINAIDGSVIDPIASH